jgi:hypothetical protein
MIDGMYQHHWSGTDFLKLGVNTDDELLSNVLYLLEVPKVGQHYHDIILL